MIIEAKLDLKDCFNETFVGGIIDKFAQECSVIIGSNTEDVKILETKLVCYQDMDEIEDELPLQEELCDCGHLEDTKETRVVVGFDQKKNYSVCSRCFEDFGIKTLSSLGSKENCKFGFRDELAQNRIIKKEDE